MSSLGAQAGLTVPAGSTYIYDLASGVYTADIEVYGTLLFEDTKDLSITAPMITVFGGGVLMAGMSCICLLSLPQVLVTALSQTNLCSPSLEHLIFPTSTVLAVKE